MDKILLEDWKVGRLETYRLPFFQSSSLPISNLLFYDSPSFLSVS